jgi:protein involved in polysaccharide export with SLBB domain
MAGGFTDEAALNAAYVVRRSYEDRKDNEFDRLQLMTVQEMSRKEVVYFRERAREIEGLISTDFVALFEQGNKSYDITLKDEDMIVVPRKDYTVNVLGHVKNPGLVPYEPNQKAKYYINSAGGYNIDAWKRKARVKKAGTGEMVSAKDTIVEMGDTIFVPEKLEREDLVRDIALITVQAVTVVMLVVQTNWYATRD